MLSAVAGRAAILKPCAADLLVDQRRRSSPTGSAWRLRTCRFAPTYNAAPQSTQPVVRLNTETGKREFALMRWGLVPYWAKDAKVGYSTINARAEEVAQTAI